jgi:hypothetical protein
MNPGLPSTFLGPTGLLFATIYPAPRKSMKFPGPLPTLAIVKGVKLAWLPEIHALLEQLKGKHITGNPPSCAPCLVRRMSPSK